MTVFQGYDISCRKEGRQLSCDSFGDKVEKSCVLLVQKAFFEEAIKLS